MSSTSSASSRLGQLKRSANYFVRGGDLYFLVGEVYYRVNSVFFDRESPTFKKLFDRALEPGEKPLGSSLSCAIFLEGVTSEEFDRFLWVFYNPRYSDYSEANFDDWSVILRLANRWKFLEVKKLAVRELQAIKNIDLIDRIILYKAHEVDQEFLSPLYVKLCSRDEPLTTAESQRLGVETTVFIFQARERVRARDIDGLKSPLPGDIDHNDVLKVVDELLGDMTLEDNASEHSRRKPPAPPKKGGHGAAASTGSLPGRPKHNRLE